MEGIKRSTPILKSSQENNPASCNSPDTAKALNQQEKKTPVIPIGNRLIFILYDQVANHGVSPSTAIEKALHIDPQSPQGLSVQNQLQEYTRQQHGKSQTKKEYESPPLPTTGATAATKEAEDTSAVDSKSEETDPLYQFIAHGQVQTGETFNFEDYLRMLCPDRGSSKMMSEYIQKIQSITDEINTKFPEFYDAALRVAYNIIQKDIFLNDPVFDVNLGTVANPKARCLIDRLFTIKLYDSEERPEDAPEEFRNPHQASLPYAMGGWPALSHHDYGISDFEAILATLTVKFECFPSAIEKIANCTRFLEGYIQTHRTPHELKTILEQDIRREIAERLARKSLDQILIDAYMEQLRQSVIDPDIIAALAGLDPLIATLDNAPEPPRGPIG